MQQNTIDENETETIKIETSKSESKKVIEETKLN